MMDEYSSALQQAEKDIAAFSKAPAGVDKQDDTGVGKAIEGIWAYDVSSNHVYWSDPLFDMLGMPRQESPLTMEAVMALVHPDERRGFEKVLQTSLTTGEPFEAEFKMRHRSGEYLAVQFVAKVGLDAEKKPDRISGRMICLSELRQVENSLRKARKELADVRHALDESTILSVTDRYGVITYINDALCRISQYSREELMGETLEIINSGPHPESFFTDMWDTIGSGQIWRGELKHRAKDGTFFWMDTTVVPLLDTRGEPFQFVVVRHETTRQKNSEQEIRELKQDIRQHAVNRTELKNINLAQRSEINQQGQEIREYKETEAELKKSLKREKLTKHLIQLMNRSFDPEIILEIIVRELGVFLDVDRCLVVLYRNETGEAENSRTFAQYCRSEAVQPVKEEEIPPAWKEVMEVGPREEYSSAIFNAPEPKQFPPDIQKYLKRNQVQSVFAVEIKFRRVVFGRLTLHQCRYPYTWTEAEINFLEILATHIGAALYQAKLYQQEKQARQEAEEANRQKSKVLSFVSHDFKNPLDGMKRLIDNLENDNSDILSEKHRELIGYIAEGVHQLRSMVVDILDKSRLAEGKITPVPQWIETGSFTDELKPLFSAMAAQRSIEVSIEIQPELTAIKADPTHLRQILINLLSNAVKYNRINGKAFLRLYKSEDGQSAIIEVQDTGPGIPAEKIPQLFTEYFRGDLSQSNLVEGTGLGLAFIKKLIELHGGRITVESKVGTGSLFRVILPLPR